MTPHFSVAFYTRHPDLVEGLSQATYETLEDMEKVVAGEVEKFFKQCGGARDAIMETMTRLGMFKGTSYGSACITIDGGKYGNIGATYWSGFNGMNLRAFYKSDGKEKYSLEILMKQDK